MVIEDIFRPASSGSDEITKQAAASAAEQRPLPMAAPIDRLAAFIADLIILLPFISLMTAPFRRQWMISRLLQDSESGLVAFTGVFGFSVIVVVLFQTVFLSLWGATPGKRLLGLKVVSVWNRERPTPLQACLRSFFWCLEGGLMFMPWLGALSNERRRPWHDRVADTEVIAVDPQRAAGPPDVREKTLVSSLNAATLCCLAGFTTVGLVRLARTSPDAVVARNDTGFLCEPVTEAHSEWLSLEGITPSRVDVALSLYGADAISASCLESEADFALWNEKADSSAYLAKSISLEDDSDQHMAYARKACEVEANGSSCRLARLLIGQEGRSSDSATSGTTRAASSRLKPLSVDELLKTTGPKSPAYVLVHLVRELNAESRFNEALQLIDRGSPHQRLGYFFASHRARALWGLHRYAEARVAFKSSLEGLGSDQRMRLAGRFCDMESLESCSGETVSSCALLDKAVERSPAALEDEELAVSWIRSQECVAGRSVDYKRLQSRVPGMEAQALLQALVRLKDNDRAGARAELTRLLEESDEDSAFWFEIQTRLVEVAQSESDLKIVLEVWSKSDYHETGWLRVGHRLLERFDEMGQQQRSLEIGSRLLRRDPFDEGLQKRLVVWAYKSGEMRTALRLLEGLKKQVNRMPASESDFDRISNELASMAPLLLERKTEEPAP